MVNDKVYRATVTAPVNIAVVKYWGKRDAKLNLPTNSSLSVTLSQADLRTLTTAACSTLFPPADSLILNGQPSDLTATRPRACLAALRTRRVALEAADPSLPKLSGLPLRVVSENNFPTAAGLASSASGFAALVRAVADLYGLPDSPGDLSVIARQGSGSACRSLFGGFVAWRAGSREDGADSAAEEVAPVEHWPELRALVLVVSAAKKAVGSTAGMQMTVATSELFGRRVAEVVPAHMRRMEDAVRDRDFPAFAEVTMRDSNSFHATCADTYPPIYYMTDTSRAAVRAVEAINTAAGRTVAAYTFDAGPNPVIYYPAEAASLVVTTFRAVLPDVPGWRSTSLETHDNDASAALLDPVLATLLRQGVASVIDTRVGGGPSRSNEHLVQEDGFVIKRLCS